MGQSKIIVMPLANETKLVYCVNRNKIDIYSLNTNIGVCVLQNIFVSPSRHLVTRDKIDKCFWQQTGDSNHNLLILTKPFSTKYIYINTTWVCISIKFAVASHIPMHLWLFASYKNTQSKTDKCWDKKNYSFPRRFTDRGGGGAY